MKVTIQFYSFWAIGSGKGGNSKDSIILLDDDGLPFIPGRTLKGLIRDAFLECGYTDEKAIKLFGHIKNDDIKTENLQAGKLRFNSAYLPDEFKSLDKEVKAKLFHTKTATRLAENKQAVDNSLRKNELSIPLELHTTILNKNDNSELDNEDFKKIENALKMLKIMGEKRHRGLGRCKITAENGGIEKEDAESTNSSANTTKKTIRFKCTITEPLILVKKAKTGQNIESLDYIPGNTFRGIVAGNIAKGDDKEVFDNIIFNNSVQFGDAHLLIDGKRSLKTPFSFYYDKNSNDDNIYNFHHLKDTDWIDKKLKSQKKGYLINTTNGFKIKNIEYGNRIKSSRNRTSRSSEDGGMFSYHYLKKGQEFEFEVNSNNPDHLKKIITILDGKTKYFGKSKTAEFGGAILIEYIGETEKTFTEKKGKYLYAESNLCFINDYGEFTATPTAKQLTDDANAVIDWEKSQVKFRTFAPYNFHRKNYDFERLIIEKGSVFAFSKEVTFTKEFLAKGLGCFFTEGYGKVLINPEFLNEEISFDTSIKEPEKTGSEEIANDLIAFIKAKHQKDEDEIKIDALVKIYAKKSFKQNKSSQWARVFNATSKAIDFSALETELYKKPKEDKRDKTIFNGGSKTWDKKDIDIIKEFLTEAKDNEIIALRKLSKIMIDKTKKNE